MCTSNMFHDIYNTIIEHDRAPYISTLQSTVGTKPVDQKGLSHPKWKSVCFPFLPLPFLPAGEGSKSSDSNSGSFVDLSPAQAFGVVPRRSSHLTVPRVRPAMRTFGFGAAGREGNASFEFVESVLAAPRAGEEAEEAAEGER